MQRSYLALIYAVLYAPILILMVFSFNEGKRGGKWQGFTFKWYGELFNDSQIMKALYYTLTIALIASIVATLIGTLAAYGIHRYKKKWAKKSILAVNNIPILNPDIVTGVALMVWFAFLFNAIFGIRNGFLTLLIAHITFCIPYVVLSVLPKLKQMPKDTVEAAMDLGAKPSQAFMKVVLPEIKPGIVTGALIAFTLSIDDFVISFFTTGSGVQNLSISIFSMARKGISPKINALSTLMFLAVIGLLIVVNKRSKIEDL
ncbi:ABC transporter permease [Fusibacter sp. A1]|nr:MULTISPECIES: ABC transporter permease [unclassified Fusibacter]NPE23274.1 ABC transporter permease [Fusibacter sp. A1]RXV59433.1 ABC transporter permease [Fusibacter sp. A1]